LHLFTVPLNEPEPIDALVVELMRGYSFEEVLEQVYKIEPSRLAISQLLIARAPVGTPIDPALVKEVTTGQAATIPSDLRFFGDTVRELGSAFVRFPDRPIYLLFSHDHVHYLSDNLNPTSVFNPLAGERSIVESTLKRIQETEMQVVVESGRARFPVIPHVLYEAPSGRLVQSFLRIGNIQRSRAAVDALFFWLLPHLRDCSAIITDTWSIGTIAFNASRRLSSYHKEGPPCPVEMVSSYLDGSPESAA